MEYVRFTSADGDLSTGRDGRQEVEEWLEVASDHRVTREIGWDADGAVAHLFPSPKYPSGDYGHFDLAPVDPTEFPKVDPALFEARWQEAQHAADLLPPLPGPTGWRAAALVVFTIAFFALVIAYYARSLWIH